MAANQFDIKLAFQGNDALTAIIKQLKEIEERSKKIGVSPSGRGNEINDLINKRNILIKQAEKLALSEAKGAKAIAQKNSQMNALSKQIAVIDKGNKDLIKTYQSEQKALDKVAKSTIKVTGTIGQLKREVINLNKQRLMATTSKEIERINRNLVRTKNRLRQLQTQGVKTSNTLGSAFKSFGFKFNLLANIASRVGFAITNGITNAIIGTVTVFKDFEQANQNLASVLSRATNKELEELKDQAVELGTVTARTSSEIVGLQTAFSRLGFSSREILNLTENTINGSIAMNANLTETAELVGAIVKSFDDLGSSDSEKVVDQLTSATQRSALNFAKLRTAIPIVGGAANAVGIPLNKLLALLGKLSDSGIDASMSATALRNIFIESAKQGLTYSQILDKIVKSSDKLTTSTDEFGKRAAVSGAILANNIGATTDLALAIDGDLTVASKAAAVQLDSLTGSTTLLKSAWEGMILSFEDGNGVITKFLRGTVDLGTSIFNLIAGVKSSKKEITNYSKTIDETAKVVIRLVRALTLTFVLGKLRKLFIATTGSVNIFTAGIQANVVGINSMRRASAKAKIAIRGMNGAMKANVLFFFIAGVLELVLAFDLLDNAADKARKSLNRFLDKQESDFDKKFNEIKDFAKSRKLDIDIELEEQRRLINGRATLKKQGDNIIAVLDKKDKKEIIEREKQAIKDKKEVDKLELARINKLISDTEKLFSEETDISGGFGFTKKLDQRIFDLKNKLRADDFKEIDKTIGLKDASGKTQTIRTGSVSAEEQKEAAKIELEGLERIKKVRENELSLLKDRRLTLLKSLKIITNENKEIEKKDDRTVDAEKAKRDIIKARKDREAEFLRKRLELKDQETFELKQVKGQKDEEAKIIAKFRTKQLKLKTDFDDATEKLRKKEIDDIRKQQIAINKIKSDSKTDDDNFQKDVLERVINNEEETIDIRKDSIKQIAEIDKNAIDRNLQNEINSIFIKNNLEKESIEISKKSDDAKEIESNKSDEKAQESTKKALKKAAQDKANIDSGAKEQSDTIEEKSQKKSDDIFNTNIDNVKELTDITLDALIQRKEAQIDRTNEEIDDKKDSISRQEELADKGLANSLAFEESQGAELQAVKIKRQKELENIQKAQAFLSLLTEFSKQNPDTALPKAIAISTLANAFFKKEDGGIMGEESNERKGINGGIRKGVFYGDTHQSKSGGVYIQAEKGEGMFSRKEMRNLGTDNFYKMKEQLRLGNSDVFNEQNLSLLEVRENNTVGYNFGRLESKLNNIEQAINNKPVSQTSFDKFGNVVDITLKDGMRKITKKKLRHF